MSPRMQTSCFFVAFPALDFVREVAERPPDAEACHGLLQATAAFSRQPSSFSSISISSQSSHSSSSCTSLDISRGHSRSWGSQESCRIAEEYVHVHAKEVTGQCKNDGDQHHSGNVREEAGFDATVLAERAQLRCCSSSGSSSEEGVPEGQEPLAFTLSSQQLAPGVWFAAADLRHADGIAQACIGADIVYHSASAGMSGAESMREAQHIYDVNVRGTANVISACRQCCVPRLVYVSTCNVAFDWTPKIGLDEASADYVSHHKLHDAYSVTKALAEQLVLDSNGFPLLLKDAMGDQAKQLRTCALRPPGIWGPGELRHTPRILEAAKHGYLLFMFGNAVSDWIHVDNLVDAMLDAAQGLDQSKECIAAGQAYFVSDGAPMSPINNFTFFGQFVEGLGYTMPRLRLPWRFVLALSMGNELLHLLLLPLGFSVPMLLCPAEVYKTAVTNFFKIDKAKEQLGYAPRAYSVHGALLWYAQNGFAAPAIQNKPSIFIGGHQGKYLLPGAATIQPSIGTARLTSNCGVSFSLRRLVLCSNGIFLLSLFVVGMAAMVPRMGYSIPL
ncbi:3-beta hydroxysteroid dehydrogenase/isomerase family-domain-containing protein [Dunaliella salina]|uniref:3-beta hydroxysteroid dehydrogenase/isomerase family-domain-containing protein n=1 Tax=Dunaliella salina TaxID=3046 RepID=A0ABQ7G2D9_DUNSA|nr:3-beta hydroxysteroid dehydrogenase/isomerase family-domain-containing protein [Dunaliella salina]|eukprot:KAF5828760.1 3-beta hydroxysteroid dehydrogenase/isomerase family-domain-containing protein [Dunaliella salina]